MVKIIESKKLTSALRSLERMDYGEDDPWANLADYMVSPQSDDPYLVFIAGVELGLKAREGHWGGGPLICSGVTSELVTHFFVGTEKEALNRVEAVAKKYR